MGWHFPENFSTVPLLTHVHGDRAFFKDGTSKRVDAIILCTGYQHHFPFMEEQLDLKTGMVGDFHWCAAYAHIGCPYRLLHVYS